MTNTDEKTLVEMWRTPGTIGTEVAREGYRRIANLTQRLEEARSSAAPTAKEGK